jgi:hypothetical protein
MVLTTNAQHPLNAIESYMENLTPPPNNKQNFSQIVPWNDKKTMNTNKHHKMPPMNASDPPTVTGSDHCKSARTNAAGSGLKLKAPPKLSCTPKSNAFSTSTSMKQKQICSPTKSPAKKMKQKCSNITPKDEDTPDTWKTVMSKSAKVAGYVAKQLIHGNDSVGVWSSDEDASSNKIEFVKQTRLFVRSTSSSRDNNDDSVQILGVKHVEKTNYYADLMAPMADYGTGKDKDEEDDDDDSTKKKITKMPFFIPCQRISMIQMMRLLLMTMMKTLSPPPPHPLPIVTQPPMPPPIATKTNRKRTKTIKTAMDTSLEKRKEAARKPHQWLTSLRNLHLPVP